MDLGQGGGQSTPYREGGERTGSPEPGASGGSVPAPASCACPCRVSGLRGAPSLRLMAEGTGSQGSRKRCCRPRATYREGVCRGAGELGSASCPWVSSPRLRRRTLQRLLSPEVSGCLAQAWGRGNCAPRLSCCPGLGAPTVDGARQLAPPRTDPQGWCPERGQTRQVPGPPHHAKRLELAGSTEAGCDPRSCHSSGTASVAQAGARRFSGRPREPLA